jgi:hypothetical protein
LCSEGVMRHARACKGSAVLAGHLGHEETVSKLTSTTPLKNWSFDSGPCRLMCELCPTEARCLDSRRLRRLTGENDVTLSRKQHADALSIVNASDRLSEERRY